MDTRGNGKDRLKTVSLSGRETAYVLKRSNRRTVGLRIDPNGLTVSIPHRMSERSVEDILVEKSGWILRKLDEITAVRKPEWSDGEPIPFLGKSYRLRISSGRQGADIDGDFLDVSARDPSMVQSAVEAWYRRQALEFFAERIAHYCARLGVEPPKLFLSNAKTRWGSCNSRGEVRLNWRLMRMPPHLVDYVVVHELSHLVEMNHSPAFWKTVASVYPSFDAAMAELKNLARGTLW